MKRTHAQMEAREKPKRVVNPFVLFVQDVKANATDHAPTSRPELKKMWEEISDEKKTEIERQHARLMMAWQRDMASYVEEYPEDSDDEEEKVVVTKKKTKKEKAPRDPNKPKKYQNAYFQFQNEKRKELKEKNPGIGGKEVQSIVSDLWKGMSDDDKKPYQAKEAKLKEAYEKAMAKYNAGLAAAGGASGALAAASSATTKLVQMTKKAQATTTTKKKKKSEEATTTKKKKATEKPRPRQIEEDVEMEDIDESDDDDESMEDDIDDVLAGSADESEELGSSDEEEDSDEEEESEEGAVIVESGSEEESSDEEDSEDSEDGVAVTFS